MHITPLRQALLAACLGTAGTFGLAGQAAASAPDTAAAAGPVPKLSTNLVNNGGFEAASLSGWGGTVLANPFSGVFCPGAAGAPEGSCLAFLGTDGAADTLSQVLGTVAGQAYSISFTFVPDGSSPSSLGVSFGNQSLYGVSSPALGAALTVTLQATAVAAATALVFSFRNDPGYFLLDNVSVTAVPEPASALLLAAGVVGLAWRCRPRQRGA